MLDYCHTEECAEYADIGFFFCKNCLKTISKLAIVLDLDETLIHTTRDISKFTSSFDFTNDTASLFTYKRPGLDTFLDIVFQNYDVYIWTAGSEEYADYILENILNTCKHKPLRVLSSCDTVSKMQGCYGDKVSLKPLSIIRKDLSRIVMIDDKQDSFSCNFDNGYKIRGFQNPDEQFNDQELLQCTIMLEKIAPLQDVRLFLKIK